MVHVFASGPGGITVIKPAGATTEAIVRQLSQQLADDLAASDPLGLAIVSRLEHPTSGVLPVALGSESTLAANWLQAQFAGRLVLKNCRRPKRLASGGLVIVRVFYDQ